ncbi:acyltransferase family protein [Neopusillimonas aromaticivorans]|uniref:acyltransferase family protein n=1 Tax=Neopusillimonas aromaticivorans TaxID=2979868 RepID=UPI002595F9BA|nr:acyltransferase [Neopusillimonas aromaticivorans]WJJ94741.1 acyltransferase [Neopusillimonas aromaticivorans]
MLGTLRLILALAVAASHVDFRIAGLNPGVSAVIGFYLISGYVMSGLLQRHYPTPSAAGNFYVDRALRLMPQYLFYAVLTLLWYHFASLPAGNASVDHFLGATPDVGDYINNLLVVPLNYYMWNGSDHFTLVPPAWSLGAEIQFYLLAPFLLLVAPPWGQRLRPFFLIVFVIALLVAVLALAGVVNSDWFGYRLLPGVLSYFFLGALLHRCHQASVGSGHGAGRRAYGLVFGAVLLAMFAGVLAYAHGSLRQPYNQEVLLGLVIIFPLLHLLARRRRQHWDELAGDVSYGVFLNHFLIFWVFFPAGVGVAQLPFFLALCVGLAWAIQRWVERPCLRWRMRWRKQHAI